MPNARNIVLATVTARYAHTAFGLRWLMANLGPLGARAVIREFPLGARPADIVEDILRHDPAIVALSAHIWNVEPLAEAARILKGVRPGVRLVVGGPETAWEYEGTPLFATADYLVRGEGELAFPELAARILNGDPPAAKVIEAVPLDLARLALPYDLYTDEDIGRRTLHVETSRGCPFRCEFCLSALDPRVRTFPLDRLFEAFEGLLARGARSFRFVDRTFNVHPARALTIMDFFLDRWREGMQLHLEVVPDLLQDELLERMAAFPPEGLHLEAGVQTFNPESLAAISREQDTERTEQVLTWLRRNTGAHIHADLVAGLPHETWESFAAGFDRLVRCGPQTIQVGTLKRLKGAPIARHEGPRRMVFSPRPPYEVMQTDSLDFERMQRIKRFARFLDLYHNAGNFGTALPLLWLGSGLPFRAFMTFSDRLWADTGRTHRFALEDLAERLYRFLVTEAGVDAHTARKAVKADYHRLPGRRGHLDLGTPPDER